MSRDEAMTKLLALGPMTFAEILEACGWPSEDVRQVLNGLCESHAVTWINQAGRRYMLTEQGRRLTWK
jgi:predicted transcriptional regulator